MIKKIIIVALIAIIAAAGGGYYYAFVYMKNKKFDMVNAEATSITSVELVKAFQTDEAGSNVAYLDKVLQITGTVSATGTTQTGEKNHNTGFRRSFFRCNGYLGFNCHNLCCRRRDNNYQRILQGFPQ